MMAEQNWGRRKPQALSLIGLQLSVIGTTILAFLVAAAVVDPIIRALANIPLFFEDDHTSPLEYNLALLVQVGLLAVGFIAIAAAFRSATGLSCLRWGLWAANPITVAAGWILFKVLDNTLLEGTSVEYSHVRNGGLVALSAPFLFAGCCRISARLSRETTYLSKLRELLHWLLGLLLFVAVLRSLALGGKIAAAFFTHGVDGVRSVIVTDSVEVASSASDWFVFLSWEEAVLVQLAFLVFTILLAIGFVKTRVPCGERSASRES